MATKPHILMCRPDHYGIEYEINPWMSRDRQADHALAVEQWEDLVALLKSLGASVSFVEPVRGLPDLVFTANAGMIYRDMAVLSRFHGAFRNSFQVGSGQTTTTDRMATGTVGPKIGGRLLSFEAAPGRDAQHGETTNYDQLSYLPA